MSGTAGERDAVQEIREDFRRHLDLLYARLNLAPPYDSVEKAVAQLTQHLARLGTAEREALRRDTARRWALFTNVFVESGLNRKHRGIIAGLARSRAALGLPPEYDHLLETFLR
jgi:hypothetical protein